MRSISTGLCAAALAAFLLPLGSADAKPARDDALVKACEADVKSLCPNVEPGQGRIARCLRDNASKVSEGCKAQLKERRAQRKDKQGDAAPAGSKP